MTSTTMAIDTDVMDKLRKCHRIKQDNPKQAPYYNTVDQLCDIYIDAVIEQRDNTGEVTG